MAATASGLRRWQVEGMDCPSCVRTIETALGKLPDVGDIKLTYTTGILQLQLGSGATASEVERRLARLGYRARHLPEPRDDSPSGAAAGPTRSVPIEPAKPLWAHPGLRPVVLIGGLVLAAWLLSLAFPALGTALFTVAALVAVAPFAWKAWVRARMGNPFTIETLMAVAALGAVAIDAASEAAVVVLLFAIGEFLEGVAADRARAGIRSLVALMPRTAWRVTPDGVREVTPEDLVIGDIILVRPGDRVPADGTISEGASHFDQSPLTGESVPVARSVGEEVLAGSVNTDGAIKVEVARASGDTALARIVRLVAEAQANKSATERFIDRFSRWYTPVAMLAAILVAVVPPLAFGADWTTWIYRALTLLLIACPCALVISTPAAIASGLAAGARRGILVKGGAALEMLARVRQVAFDKTGTLTVGRPVVTDVVPASGQSDRQLLALAASVETGSAHPIAKAIQIAAEADKLPLRPARDHRAVAGKGVTAVVQGRSVALMAPRFASQLAPLSDELAAQITAFEEQGKTVMVLIADGAALGLVAVRDEPRPDSQAAIGLLTQAGITPTMLTGDNRRTSEAIAGALGLKVQAELLPDGKLAAIEMLQRNGPTAMVGDGINDAPALATADVGIAMGGGTDVALETADAALIKDRVTGVSELIMLARATMANVRQNITVALGFKAVFLVTSLTGLTGLWMAILADTGATVLVTLNALRLLRFTWRTP